MTLILYAFGTRAQRIVIRHHERNHQKQLLY